MIADLPRQFYDCQNHCGTTRQAVERHDTLSNDKSFHDPAWEGQRLLQKLFACSFNGLAVIEKFNTY